MSTIRIKPDELTKTIMDDLDEYRDSLTDKVKKSVQEAATEAVKELKQTSPKKTGRYRKSWRKKTVKDNSNGTEVIVHAGRYQLTHLLENGHAKRGGGRVEGIPHIKPAEEHATEKLEKDIEKEVKGG